MPSAAGNGIDIYFAVHGAGPPLLNISGSGNDLRRAPASILPVDKVFETLSYDQRGLGQTSKPEADYTMADYADDPAALIHSMGWASCHVLGTSFGGMVALNLAVRHPDLVDRLVLCCTSPGGVAPATATPDPEQAAGLRRQLAARAGRDVVADLSSIMPPTLVWAGHYDDIGPMENSELIADRIPVQHCGSSKEATSS